MNIEKLFPHFITLTLLVLSAVYRSPLFAYAAVVAMGCTLAYEIIKVRVAALAVKTDVPEELKRHMHDMNTRITTIEYGIKQRGF
jgi:hypothetical protein